MDDSRIKKLRYIFSFHKAVIQQNEEYSVFACFAVNNRPNFPSRATIKKIKRRAGQSDVEVSILKEITGIYGSSLPIPEYIDHVVSKDGLCLIVSALDKPLADEIRDRRSEYRLWTEFELWQHLSRISSLIYQLHCQRIVHRNISPNTLFLKGNELYLFHFEDCKRLGKNDTLQAATIRGAVNFLSPQAEAALKYQLGMTYEVSRKDDVWGLGRTFLDMASLRINSDLSSHFDSSQEQFSQYIESIIDGSYSNVLKAAIKGLLILDSEHRPNFEDFYEWLRNNYHKQPCCQCSQPVELLWPCNHIYCSQCIRPKIANLVLSNASAIQICPCNIPVSSDFFASFPVSTRKLADLILFPKRSCRCGTNFNVLIDVKGRPQPYFLRCPNCNYSHCSYCDAPAEHKTLLVKRICPEFAHAVA